MGLYCRSGLGFWFLLCVLVWCVLVWFKLVFVFGFGMVRLVLVGAICGSGLLRVWGLCVLLAGLPLWFGFGGLGWLVGFSGLVSCGWPA